MVENKDIEGFPTFEQFSAMVKAYDEFERALDEDGEGCDLTPRECDCEKDEEARGLDVAHVTFGVWAVLCKDCGALGVHSSTEQGCVENWNDNKLSRPIGYARDPKRLEEAKERAKAIWNACKM